MTGRADLLKEARRCAYEASRGVSPGRAQMYVGLSRFYNSLASSEPEHAERRPPAHRKSYLSHAAK